MDYFIKRSEYLKAKQIVEKYEDQKQYEDLSIDITNVKPGRPVKFIAFLDNDREPVISKNQYYFLEYTDEWGALICTTMDSESEYYNDFLVAKSQLIF